LTFNIQESGAAMSFQYKICSCTK